MADAHQSSGVRTRAQGLLTVAQPGARLDGGTSGETNKNYSNERSSLQVSVEASADNQSAQSETGVLNMEEPVLTT